MFSRSSLSLVQYFSEFYQEIAAIKKEIANGSLPSYLAGGKKVQSDKQSQAEMTSMRLYSILVQQAKEVREKGSEQESKGYRLAQYIMSALADELFLIELEWDGNELWAENLLEYRLFKSSMSGRNLFVYLGKLLKSRNYGPMQREQAIVFLMALQLGFKGQYTGKSGHQHLMGIRKDLLNFIGFSSDDNTPLFPQASYQEYRLSKPFGERLAPVSLWYKIGGGCFLMYLLVSTGVWYQASSTMTDVLPSRCVHLQNLCLQKIGNDKKSCLLTLQRQCSDQISNTDFGSLIKTAEDEALKSKNIISEKDSLVIDETIGGN